MNAASLALTLTATPVADPVRTLAARLVPAALTLAREILAAPATVWVIDPTPGPEYAASGAVVIDPSGRTITTPGPAAPANASERWRTDIA